MAFEKALAFLIQRHESLRSTFITPNGEARQYIHDQIDLPIRFLNLSSQNQVETLALEQSYLEAQDAFDLE